MPESPSGIFISYRRESSAGFAGRLYDRLTRKFGEARVFMDIDRIRPGDDFIQVLETELANAVALIALIGRDWLTCKDEDGNPRLSNPHDFVRLEIATALSRGIRVIPVLIDGARPPASKDLPDDLAPLSRRQALEIEHARFNQDAARLIEACEELLNAALPQAGAARVNPRDGLTYIWIPPGTFTIGCSPGDEYCLDDEKPAHQVTIAKGFWLGQTPVTQAAYQHLTENNPSEFTGDKLPAEVTWGEAERYCSLVGGRLPTEAEWEYAARAGSAGRKYGESNEIAWHFGNSNDQTHDVATLQPNAWGLYDMLGNVWEWTADWYGGYKSQSQTDPKGRATGRDKVLRGGAWSIDPRFVGASIRSRGDPGDGRSVFGFRCVWEF
jgi:formylglycine-generating enzyme required for sulfatase activity